MNMTITFGEKFMVSSTDNYKVYLEDVGENKLIFTYIYLFTSVLVLLQYSFDYMYACLQLEYDQAYSIILDKYNYNVKISLLKRIDMTEG